VSRDVFTTLWKREAKKGIRDLSQAGRQGGLFSIDLPIQFPKAVQAVVGKGKPNLRVTGSETISFNGISNWTAGQQYSEYGRQSKFPRLDMKQDLVVKMGGTIGDKIDVDWDQSSAARTELQNRIRIRYHGYDDEIIQSVDLGNTNLSIPNTQYVSYSGMHEGLFGIKSVAKLGSVDLTVIASKQEGKQDKQRIVGGARTVQQQIQEAHVFLRRTA
jgi:cell surface protein SprA